VVQLDILSGRQAGTHWVARRFPFQVGRSPQATLILEEPGVWDRHAEFALRPGEGVLVSALGDAAIVVNGQPVRQAVLRNGDLIEAGSVKLRFGLAPTRQHSLGLREAMTWIALAALFFAQLALTYRIAG
jgi:pSer/pThr/pTyr-binding forkhead associated (FHA) protein